MGRRGEAWRASISDTSKLPGRQLTDEEIEAMIAAVRVSRKKSAQAWGEALARLAVELGKVAAAG